MHHQLSRPGIGLYGHANYVLVKSLPWGGSEVSFFAGAAPAVANGDMAVASLLTAPDGFSCTLSSTGVPTIQSGGSTARQAITLDVYDNSLKAWMGQVTDYVNDKAPEAITSTPQILSYAVNDDVEIDLSAYFFDFEGDEMVYTVLSGTLPDGLTISGSFLSGTVTTAYSGDVVFEATDTIGLTGPSPTFSITVTEGTLTWPDLTGLNLSDATAALLLLGLTVGTTTSAESTETEGTVIAQDPAAGAPAEVGDSVNLTLAQGALASHHRGKRQRATMEITPQLTTQQQAVLDAREAAHKLFNRIPTMQGPVLTPIEAKADAIAKAMLLK